MLKSKIIMNWSKQNSWDKYTLGMYSLFWKTKLLVSATTLKGNNDLKILIKIQRLHYSDRNVCKMSNSLFIK